MIKNSIFLTAGEKHNDDSYIIFSWKLKKKIGLLEAGTELAFHQEKLPSPSNNLKECKNLQKTDNAFFERTSEKFDVIETETEVKIDFFNRQLIFDKNAGKIKAYYYDGVNVFQDGPMLNLWRAPIDNDILGLEEFGAKKVLEHWKEKNIHLLQHNIRSFEIIEKNHDYALINVSSEIAPPVLDWGYKTDYMYKIHRNGMISVKISGKLYGNAPETLPRIGVVMNIDKRFKNVKWLGLGPHESYIDSCSSVKFDLWERKIEDMHTPYIFPQENGNRHNVKSFSLEDERNIRMYFETLDEKFDFSISEYTIENIENAGHTYDLKKSDFLQLKIDMEQYGLGSASCGEEVLEKYRLYCKDFEFSFKFSVFSK